MPDLQEWWTTPRCRCCACPQIVHASTDHPGSRDYEPEAKAHGAAQREAGARARRLVREVARTIEPRVLAGSGAIVESPRVPAGSCPIVESSVFSLPHGLGEPPTSYFDMRGDFQASTQAALS